MHLASLAIFVNELCLSVIIFTMAGVLSIMLLSARVTEAVSVPPQIASLAHLLMLHTTTTMWPY